MATKCETFWLTAKLDNLRKLMDQTWSYAQEDDGELYLEDLNDMKTIYGLFRNSDAEKIASMLLDIDTLPREQIVMALVNDCGEAFVEENFGFSVA